ncbi:MAG: hypothetical protein LRZ84_07680 [Desertifilum sp.]|nr:hypothetical protein [Desertifilum sp.]
MALNLTFTLERPNQYLAFPFEFSPKSRFTHCASVRVIYEDKAPDAEFDPDLPIPKEERAAWYWEIRIGRFRQVSDPPYHTLAQAQKLAQQAFSNLVAGGLAQRLDRSLRSARDFERSTEL